MGGGDRVKTPRRVVSDPPRESPEEHLGPSEDSPREPWWEPWVSTLLVLLTIGTTLTSGALLQGVDPLGLEFRTLSGIPLWWPTRLSFPELLSGATFSLPFVTILLVHEWSHRIAARRYGVRTSLPFLIPFPAHISVVGTLGGFIRLRSAIPSRRALLDVGLSGPLSSLLLSIPILAVGLVLSVPSDLPAREGLPFVILFQDIPIRLGEPMLTRGLLALLPVEMAGAALHLHPLAFAGWLGLILTFLNLLPLGQLDGGHILYALHPGRQRWWSRATVGIFLVLGFQWAGWWAWAVVMLLLGRGRALPPDAVGAEPTPDRLRRVLAWLVMASLLLLLPPIPISF